MSSHPGGREPDSDTNKGSFRTNLISFILTLFTEKLIKSCFKELVLAYYQVWIDDFKMFTYFKTLHNTAYIFNVTLIILGEWL